MNTGAGNTMTLGETILWKGKKIPALLPGLEFSEAGHIYKINGRQLKSVTQYTGLLSNHDFAKQVDLDWGTAVHNYLYLSDIGRLAPGGDERMEPYITGWKAFCIKQGWDTGKMLAEYPLYSKKYLYTGRFDRLFETANYDYLIDIKTGQPSAITGMQLAAYGQAAIEWDLTNKTRLRLVECCIDNTGRVRPQMFDFKTELNYFLMAYSLQNFLK